MSSQNYLGSFTEMEVAGEGRLEKQCRNLSMKKTTDITWIVEIVP